MAHWKGSSEAEGVVMVVLSWWKICLQDYVSENTWYAFNQFIVQIFYGIIQLRE
jgi:hypothetical protein